MRFALVLLALVAGLVAARTADAAPAPLTRIMVEVINPAANTVWGARSKHRLSDKEWEEVKQAVVMLSSASETVAAGGPTTNELSKSAQWREWSAKFATTLQRTKRASDHKDQRALISEGNALIGVCEGCHMAVAVLVP